MLSTNINKGFTLVEMLLYGAILMMFLTVLTALFSSLIELQLSSESNTSLAQDGRYIFSRLSYDVGRASDIILPASAGGTGTTLHITISGSSQVYSVVGGNLTVTNSSGTYTLNSSGTSVSGLTVRRLGNTGGKQSVQVLYTITSRTTREYGVESRTFQSAFALR